MADVLATNDGELTATFCTKCGLSATPQITVWDLAWKEVTPRLYWASVSSAISESLRGDREVTIWQGDLQVAHVKPGEGLWLFAGYCRA